MDHFNLPMVYMLYTNSVVGPNAMDSTSLQVIYELTAAQDRAFVIKAFGLEDPARAGTMAKLYFKEFNQFQLLQPQGRHLSASFFVNTALQFSYNKTLATANFLAGVKYIHQHVHMKHMTSMYSKSSADIFEKNIAEVLNTIQVGVTELLYTNRVGRA